MIIPIGSIVYYETYFPHGPHKISFSLINDQLPNPKIEESDEDLRKEQNELVEKIKPLEKINKHSQLYRADKDEGGEDEGIH